MKTVFKLVKITDRLYCVQMDSWYDLGMLFLRYQEYYENIAWKGKVFSISEFCRWYASKQDQNYCSYADDSSGYNVPSTTLEEVFKLDVPDLNQYDRIMDLIYTQLSADCDNKKFYLIGTHVPDDEWALDHEIAHGLYYLNQGYRVKANEIVSKIPKGDFEKFEQILRDFHYHHSSHIDEIQAYLTDDPLAEYIQFAQGKKYHKAVRKLFKKHMDEIKGENNE
jgi:hypothetical protein